MIGRHRQVERVILFALTAVTLATTIKYGHDERASTDCRNKQFAYVLQVQKTRSEISTASDNAKSDLLKGVGDLILNPAAKGPNGHKLTALFKAYNAEVDKVAAARAANPLPDPKSPC